LRISGNKGHRFAGDKEIAGPQWEMPLRAPPFRAKDDATCVDPHHGAAKT
jgi:hypothetical protein